MWSVGVVHVTTTRNQCIVSGDLKENGKMQIDNVHAWTQFNVYKFVDRPLVPAILNRYVGIMHVGVEHVATTHALCDVKEIGKMETDGENIRATNNIH